MDEKKLNDLQNEIDVSMMFLKAAEEAKQKSAEREQRNKAKAKAAAERRRREKALDEAYAVYTVQSDTLAQSFRHISPPE